LASLIYTRKRSLVKQIAKANGLLHHLFNCQT